MLASGCRGLRLSSRQLPAALKASHICLLPSVVRGENVTNPRWISSHSATTTQKSSDAKVNHILLNNLKCRLFIRMCPKNGRPYLHIVFVQILA